MSQTSSPTATLLDLAREARREWAWTIPWRGTRTPARTVTRRNLAWRLLVVKRAFEEMPDMQLKSWSAAGTAEIPFLPPAHDGTRLNRALRDLWAVFGGVRMNRWLRKCLRLEIARRESL